MTASPLERPFRILLLIALALVMLLRLTGCGPAYQAHQGTGPSPPPPTFSFIVQDDYRGPWPGTPHVIPIQVSFEGAAWQKADAPEAGAASFTTQGIPAWVYLVGPFWSQTYYRGKDYPDTGTQVTVRYP